MKRKDNHLTDKDRIFLRAMLERHYPKNKIAQILKVDRSTIYCELKRNSFKHCELKVMFIGVIPPIKNIAAKETPN